MSDFINSSRVSLLKKKSSFYELLDEYEVQIPVFQREYAQGRKTSQAENVRRSFVRSLCDAVHAEKELDLNLIYVKLNGGTESWDVRSVNNRSTILIVDGQQRLTMLFLFYLYHLDSDNVKVLNSFTYSGRDSTKTFCKNLIEDREFWKRESEHCLDTEYLFTQSDAIQNRPWFLPVWKRDPSIMGMLAVLDEIHTQWCQLSNRPSFCTGWKELIISSLRRVIFSLISVQDEYDSYLKMNARGKRLSPFEILKAYLDKKALESKRETAEIWKAEIDNSWLDTVWAEINKKNKDDALSETCNLVLFRLTLTLLLIYYVVRDDELPESEESSKSKESLMAKVRGTIENPERVLSSDELETLTKDGNAENCFSFLVKGFSRIVSVPHAMRETKKSPWFSESLSTWWSPLWEVSEERDVYSRLANHFSYADEALLYAYVLSEDESFAFRCSRDWWRIVHNILENQSIESEKELISAIRRLKKLHQAGTWESLRDIFKTKGFAENQCKEESKKLELLYKDADNDNWRIQIENAERLPWLKGRISFLLAQMKNLPQAESAQTKNLDQTEEFNRLLDYYVGKFGNSDSDDECVEKRTRWIEEVLPRLEDAHRQNSALWEDIYFEFLGNDTKLKEFLYCDWQKQLFKLDRHEPVPSSWLNYLGERYANRAFSRFSNRDGSGSIMSIRNKNGKILAYVGKNVPHAICIDDTVAWWYDTFDKLRGEAKIYKWMHEGGEPWIELSLGNVPGCNPEGLIIRFRGATRQVQVGVDSIDKGVRKLLFDKGIMTNNLKDDECWAPFDEECREWQDDELDELVEVLKRSMVEEILRGLRKSPESGGVPGQE